MPSERECAAVQEHITEALLAHREPEARQRAHALACAQCAAHQRALGALGTSLESFRVEPPTLQRSAALQVRVREELLRRAGTAPASAGAPRRSADLPRGFRREVARLLLAALAPLPVVLLWNLGVVTLGSELLSGLVPRPVIQALAVFYGLAASVWLAVLYGAIPFVAHRQVTRRIREVLS